MALNVGELYAKLKLDLTDFNKGIKDVQKQLTSIGNNKAFDVFSTKAVNALTKIGNMQARIYKQMNDNLKLKTQLAIANMSREEAAEQRKHQLKMAQIQREIALKAQQTQLAISLIRKESDAFKAESARKAQADRNLTQERIANLRSWERVALATTRSWQQQYSSTVRLLGQADRNRISETRRLEQQAHQQKMTELKQAGALISAGYFTGALQGNVFQSLFSFFSVTTILGALQSVASGVVSMVDVIARETTKAIEYNADLEMSFNQLKFLVTDSANEMTTSYEQIVANRFERAGFADFEAKAKLEVQDQGLVSAQKLTRAIYDDLKNLSIESPTLKFADVMQGAARLKNAGVEADQLYRNIQAIGDGAAVTGKDAIRNFDRATYAISQMYQKQGIYAEEFRKQLGNTGIATFSALEASTNISQATLARLMDAGLLRNKTTLKELSDATGVTVKELAERFGDTSLTAESTINWVDKYIEGLEMVRGGAMVELAETFTGLINVMSERWKFFSAEITKPLFDTVKSQLIALNEELDRTFNTGALKANLSSAFYNLGVILQDLVTNWLPPILDYIDDLALKLSQKTYSWIFDFHDEIVQIGKEMPNILDNVTGFIMGFIGFIVDLGQAILWLGGTFNQLKDNLYVLIPIIGPIIYLFEGLNDSSSTFSQQIEGLIELFLILTTVMITFKTGIAIATLMFFSKSIFLAKQQAAAFVGASSAVTATQAAMRAELLATAAAQTRTASITATSLQLELQLRAQNAKLLGQETLAKNLNNLADKAGIEAKRLETSADKLATDAGLAQTAAENANTAATNANTAAQGANAGATGAAGNAAAGAAVKQTILSRALNGVSVAIKGVWTSLGPIGIAVLAVSTAMTFLIPQFIDLGDEAGIANEKMTNSFKDAQIEIARTAKLIKEGIVSRNVKINVKTDVTEIDFSRLPNYNSDGTIQGPDMVVRVITEEEAAKRRKETKVSLIDKQLKEAQKALEDAEDMYNSWADRQNVGKQKLRADNIRKAKAEVNRLQKIKDDVKAGKSVPEAEKVFEAEAEKMMSDKTWSVAVGLRAVRAAGLITEAQYKQFRNEAIELKASGQKGLDTLVEDWIKGTRQGVAAGAEFKKAVFPFSRDTYYENTNIGEILQELKNEKFFNLMTADEKKAFEETVRKAVYLGTPNMIRNAIQFNDKNRAKKAREEFTKRVLAFDPTAFDLEKSTPTPDYTADGGTENDFESSLETGVDGKKGLSPYEKLKRTAEHLKAMGKSAKDVYNKWKEAQAVAYKEVDADEGLANFRESQEKMLDILNEAEKEKTKKIEDWQSIQEKALEKSYKNRKDALDKYYRDIDDKEDVAKLQEEKRRLEIERTFYAGATSAEGISKLAEIDSKMRDNNKAIEKKNRDITKQNEEDALESGKETADKLISSFANTKIGALDDRNKTSTAYIDWIDFVYKNVTDKKSGFVSDFQKKFPMKQGAPASTSSVAGPTAKPYIDSSTTTSNKTLEWLQSKGIINTYKMPEMPKATEAKTAYAGASYGFANPMGQLVAAGGTVNNFNGALVNVNTMYVRDDQDVANIGKEMFRTAQRAATAQGGRI
jgi:tape measure domain-containing protein